MKRKYTQPEILDDHSEAIKALIPTAEVNANKLCEQMDTSHPDINVHYKHGPYKLTPGKGGINFKYYFFTNFFMMEMNRLTSEAGLRVGV